MIQAEVAHHSAEGATVGLLAPERASVGKPTFTRRLPTIAPDLSAEAQPAKVEGATVGLSLMNELRLASHASPENLHELFEFGAAETALNPSARTS
jgi:hypothetical protein